MADITLFTQILAPNAKSPVACPDGTYDLYSYETVRIEPGERRVVSTGIAIAVPDDCYPVIKSSSLAVSQNVEVIFSSLDQIEHTIDKDARYPPLDIFLRNHSSEVQEIKAGTVIAKLLLSRIALFQVKSVNNLIEAVSQINITKTKMPSTPYLWLITEYRNNPDGTIARFMSEETIESFREFKQTPAYVRSRNKLQLEEKKLWSILSEDEKSAVRSEFIIWKTAQKRSAADIEAPEEELESVPELQDDNLPQFVTESMAREPDQLTNRVSARARRINNDDEEDDDEEIGNEEDLDD